MDVHSWAEKNLAKWGWRQVLAGLVLGAFAAWLAGAPLAARSAQRDALADRGGNVPGVVSYMYDRRDSRGFIPAPAGPKEDGVFDLMIVADSSFLIIDPPPQYAHNNQRRFTLTKMIASHIGRIGGKRLRIHEYYQDGTRTADIRRVVLHGISDPNIDAVAIALNPFLYFNDFMSFAGTTQRSKLLYMDGLEASDYGQLLATLRPSDLMMDALSSVSALYERRFPVSQMTLAATRAVLSRGLPFPIREAPPRGPPYMIYDWIRWLFPPEVLAKVLESRKQIFYAASVQANNLGPDSIGQTTLRANLRTLRRWGKPAILYVPPIDPVYFSDASWPMVRQIIRQFELIGAQFAGRNVKMVTEMATKAYPPVLYHDPYHMKSGEGFVRQFADMLEKQLNMPIERRDVSGMFGPGS